jgi:peroxiredoxin
MSEEFGPLRVPFELGGQVLEVSEVMPDGSKIIITSKGRAPVRENVVIGKALPSVNMMDIDGNSITNSVLKGHVSVVYFCGSWCGICRQQAAPMAALYRRLQHLGLKIVSISLDTDTVDMVRFRERYGHEWPIVMCRCMSWESVVARQFNADASGLIYIIDRKGRVDSVHSDVASAESRIEELLTLTDVT